MENVEIEVMGVKTTIDFEVTKIMGYKDPYPSLLGIDWAYDNYVIIDLKRDTMKFEANGIKVVQPLDPCLGPRYTEPVEHNIDSEALDQLYTITAGTTPDYTNPSANGVVSWRIIQYALDDLVSLQALKYYTSPFDFIRVLIEYISKKLPTFDPTFGLAPKFPKFTHRKPYFF
jgi:hypothetical protein